MEMETVKSELEKEMDRKYLVGFLHEPGFSFTIEAKYIREAMEKVLAKTKHRRKEILIAFYREDEKGIGSIRQYPTIEEWLAEKKRLEELENQ